MQNLLKDFKTQDYTRFEGRTISLTSLGYRADNTKKITVAAIDYNVGITIKSDNTSLCINGQSSPHKTTPNYDEIFQYLIKGIDNWTADANELYQIIHRRNYNPSPTGGVSCGFSV